MKFTGKKSFIQKIITGLVMLILVLTVISPVFLSAKKTQAAFPVITIGDTPMTFKTIKDTAHQLWEKTTALRGEVLKKAGWAAFKAALQNFLHKIAYQTAEWIATGAKGQKPAFFTGKWDEYLDDAVGAAVGSFAEEFSKGMSDTQKCDDQCSKEADKCSEDPDKFNECVEKYDDCVKACGELGTGANTFAQKLTNFICSPDLDIAAKITLNLPMVKEPSRPQCNLTTMKKNWSSQIRSFDFAKQANSLFDPRQTDIGAAMYEMGGALAAMKQGKETAEKERGTRTEGVQPPKQPVSESLQSPPDLTSEVAKRGVGNTAAEETPPPPGILSSTVAVFTNTLMSKAMNYWLQKGLQALSDALSGEEKLESARRAAKNLGRDPGLYEPEAGPVNLGREGARIAFADLLNVETQEGGVKDIVGELLTCPNSAKPGPTNCVIDNSFAEAIRQGLTLQEAVDQGLIKKDAVFGFDLIGEEVKEPAHNEGYPYRSLIILRKYRVAPVGWEIAAEYIKKFPQIGKQSFSKLTQAYNQADSPFYGLVDPSWVLTLPEVNCRRQGYGFEIMDYQTAGGYDQDQNGSYDDVSLVPYATTTSTEEFPGDQPPTLNVARQENYCADEQSCIQEDNSGRCLTYGYCQEEKRTWDLDTDKCQDYYNTCQTFTNRTGSFSYLENTLDWNGCNSDNAGCNWYCQDYDPFTDNWTCHKSEEVWQACSTATCEEAPGCSFTSNKCRVYQDATHPTTSPYCDIPFGGTECTIPGCSELLNLASNAGFEEGKGTEPTNWVLDAGSTAHALHYHQKITFSKAHGGDNVLRSYALNSTASVRAESAPINGVNSAKDYTFSLWIYNDLVQGGGLAVELMNAGSTVVGMDCEGTATSIAMAAGDSKGSWVKKSCDLTAGQLVNGYKISLRTYGSAGTPLTGTVYFDDLELKEKCAVASQKLHLGTDLKEEAEIYLDNSVKECEAQFEGCSEYISLLGEDINYLPNNNFEEFEGTIDDDINDVFPGWQAVSGGQIQAVKDAFTGSTGAEVTGRIQAAVATASSLANRTFTLSFKAKNGFNSSGTEVDCAGTFWISEGEHKEFRPSSSWLSYEATFTFPKDRTVEDFDIYFNLTSTCRLDAMAVEEAAEAGEYRDYGASNQIYLNKPPDYFGCRGYTTISTGNEDENECNRTSVDLTEFYNRGEECARAGYTWSETAKTCTGYKYWRDDIQRCVESGSEACQNYSLYCSEEDVGCNLFTPVDSGDPVAGRVSPNDYCPAECVGYETYQQSMNDFENETIKYFISPTAQTCSASAAGCSEFTNLDQVAAGGEGLEYYYFVRQCVKKSDSACTTFYSWEGDDQTGYQIKTYLLKQDVDTDGIGPDTADGSPAMTDHEDSTMNCQPYYGLKSYQQGYDAEITPDCREIYDQTGNVYYRRFSRTISCSDDCHALRWTMTSEDADTNEENCNDHGGEWGDEDGNGTNDCIYWAVPGESMSCAASENNCREYIGNIGNNWQIVLSDDFEDATSLDWQNASVSTEAITFGNHALKSTSVNEPMKKKINGTCHLASCGITDGCACQDTALGVGVIDTEPSDTTLADCWVQEGQDSCAYKTTIAAGKSYLISFWTKMPNVDSDGIDIILEFDDNPAKRLEITPANANYSIGQNWQVYNLGPIMLSEDQAVMSDHLTLLFADLDQTLFIDEIIIKEVKENIYAIRDSWQTASACDNALGDPFGQVCGGSQYSPKRCDGPIETDPTNPPAMIGCRAYQDTSGNLHTLRQFTNLCREELVGCQTLLDTKNSTSPFSYTYHSGDPSAVYVPPDEFVYLVVDPEKTCPNTAKGCSRLGRPILNQEDQATEYADVYLINDPDQYDQIMCLATESSCGAYETGSGQAFFKDPGQKLCVYQEAKGAKTEGWYKLNSMAEIPDCPSLAHPTYRTIGDGRAIKQTAGVCIDGFSSYPDNYCFEDSDCYGARAYCSTWVGACPAAQSACSEFIDPISVFNSNVVYNPNFKGDVDDNNEPDGWAMTVSGQEYNQSVSLERNTLYVMGLEGSMAQASLTIACANYEIYSPDQSVAVSRADCDSSHAGEEYCAIIDKPVDQISRLVRIYNTDNSSCRLYFSEDVDPDGFMNPPDLATGNNGAVIMRRAAITYNLDKNIDYTSCNGVKDLNEGCVLMNRRQVDGSLKHEKLLFSSDLTPEKDVPEVCSEDLVCDSNVLVKARPDRTCDKWLFCENYEKRKDKTGQETEYCADLGLCNSLNKELECNNFVFSDERVEQVYNSADVSKIKNLSGYSKVGYTWTDADSTAKIAGIYPLDLIIEKGSFVADFNGSFEAVESQFDPKTLPYGWEIRAVGDDSEERQGTNFAVVDDPAEVQRCNVINGKGECMQDIVPPDGRNFLRINADAEIYIHHNNLINVFPNTSYIISGYLNTQKFSAASGEARAIIGLKEYDVNNKIIPQEFDSGVSEREESVDAKNIYEGKLGVKEDDLYLGSDYLSANQGWTKITYSFRTQSQTKFISLVLLGLVQTGMVEAHPNRPQFYFCSDPPKGLNCSGKIYYDNINILPALEVGGDQFITRMCRLYTKNDSLSCEYVDESGVKNRGWYGYCLEPDPNNKNYCLQWWPLDVVKGADPLEDEGLKLAGPIYYCLQVENDDQDRDAPLLPIGIFDFGVDTAGADEATTDAWTLGEIKDFQGKLWNQVLAGEDEAIGTSDDDVVECTPIDGNGYTEYSGNNPNSRVPALLPNNPGVPSPNPDALPGRLQDAGYNYGTFLDTNGVGGSCDGLGNCTDAFLMLQTALQGAFGWWFYPDYQSYFRAATAEDPKAKFLDIIAYKQKAEDESGICWESADPVYGCDMAKENDRCDKRARFLRLYFGKRAPYCSVIVEAVLPSGLNKAWASRVAEGSSYKVDEYGYTYDYNYYPYGAILPPKAYTSNPERWDKIYYVDDRTYKYYEENTDNEEKISYDEVSIKQLPKDYERAGAPYGCDGDELNDSDSEYNQQELTCKLMSDDRFVENPNFSAAVINKGVATASDKLSRVFAGSYNWYVWDSVQKKYITDENLAGDINWSPPATPCPDHLRPSNHEDEYCAIAPRILNTKINDRNNDIILTNGYGQVTLSFNIDADQDQLPVKRIVVDWGDGTQTDLANLSLLDRPSADNPIKLSHYYYYRTFNDLYPDAYQSGAIDFQADCDNIIDGSEKSCFQFKPRIKVWDNWDWCSGTLGSASYGYYGSDCETVQTNASTWAFYGDSSTSKQYYVYVLEP